MSETLNGAVLAAGRGTRLRPLTAHRPKPLLPLAGRPLLSWALEALRAAHVGPIGVNAFHLGAQVQAAFVDDPQVVVVHEAELLGTGGGVRGIAAALPPGPIVVINGDAVFDFPLGPLIEAHRRSGAMGTLALRVVPPEAPFGRVGVDAAGRLHRIAEVEGPDADQPLRFGAFTGVQILEPALLAAIPEGHCDVLRTAWKARLWERAPLFGVFVAEDAAWFDVGTPERYLAAHRAVLAGRLPAPHLPRADAAGRRVHPGARVAADATLVGPCAVLAGAEIGGGAVVGPHAFVDRGARVAPGARVQDAVIWPGAEAVGEVVGATVISPAP